MRSGFEFHHNNFPKAQRTDTVWRTWFRSSGPLPLVGITFHDLTIVVISYRPYGPHSCRPVSLFARLIENLAIESAADVFDPTIGFAVRT